MGDVYALSGRRAEGLSLLQGALTSYEALGASLAFYSLLVVLRGEACLVEGWLEEAFSFAGCAPALVRERGERGYEPWALRLLGEIASHRQPPDVETAKGQYHQALALATELGMRPLEAHCHLGLGKLYRRTGDWTKAEEQIKIAIALYRAMDMGFYLAQGEAALATSASGSWRTAPGRRTTLALQGARAA